jgi:hypothetical protein
MKVKVCHQSKRATMQQTQADSLLQTKADPVLRFLIEDAVASHSSLKMVLVVHVCGTSVRILAMGQTETRSF